jgi:hypothetical protein
MDIKKRYVGQRGKQTKICWHYVNKYNGDDKKFVKIQDLADYLDYDRKTINNIINKKPIKNKLLKQIYDSMIITRC